MGKRRDYDEDYVNAHRGAMEREVRSRGGTL